MLDDGSIGIEIDDTPESATFYRASAGRPVERLGSTPRPIAALGFSRDLKVVAVMTRDHRGDAWTSRVVR